MYRASPSTELTSPVAAARAAVATGAWVKSKHGMYLWKCGSLSFIFTHPPEDENKTKNKKPSTEERSIHRIAGAIPPSRQNASSTRGRF